MSPFAPQRPETIFTYGAPGLKFGVGARHELSFELSQLGARRVFVITDPGVAATGKPDQIVERLRLDGFTVVLYERVRVEPTDASLNEAAYAAGESAPFDAVVAIGGGSSIDTAKAVSLLLSNDGDLIDYVNAPVGEARIPAEPLVPIIALPTTTGTGSESTAICVLDVPSQNVKTGISHVRLRPTLAIVDPELTLTQPPGVTAASGLDILCHALESYTARSYTSYERKKADERVPYCGANPIADLWSEKALSLTAGTFRKAVNEGDSLETRTQMAMAATFAGLGFGNAGVHIPHANAYPIAGNVLDFHAVDYPTDHPLIPHGMAVSLTAPAAFRFTFDSSPERHIQAARLLAPTSEMPNDPADFLPDVLTSIMRDVGIPPGLHAVGYGADDIDSLVEGSMKQQRLLATAPREVAEKDLADIFEGSLELW